MELKKFAGGSDMPEDTSVLVEGPVGVSKGRARIYWSYDRNYPENPGRFYLGMDGLSSTGSQPDSYEVRMEPSEVGMIVGAMHLRDVEAVMCAFLDEASPEVI